jgi:DNA-binding LacI/PurR family transcriptional regulator
VGRHLAARGHSEIALLSHLSLGEVWLGERLNALRHICRVEGKVHLFTPALPARGVPYLPLSRRVQRAVGAVLGNERWHQLLPSLSLHKHFLPTIYQVAMMAQTSEAMAPVFARVLRETNATAWVCVNDEVALAALQFLHRNNVAVPDRVAVVGFDNHPTSRLPGLTTYDFCYSAMGRVAVECLMRPQAIRKSLGAAITVQGRLMLRSSTEGEG